MIYTFINLCVFIVTCVFYRLCLVKQQNADSYVFFPLLNVCIFQSILAIFLYLLELSDIHIFFITKMYIFAVYYSLVVLFRFTCNFANTTLLKASRIISAVFVVLIAFYCFFLLVPTPHEAVGPFTLYQTNVLFYTFEIGHYAYTSDALILPVLSLIVLIIRAIVTKNNVLRYKLILIASVFISVFFFFIILVFEGNTKQPLNYLFSLATLYLILILYRISLVDHVLSFDKTRKFLKRMFFEYVLFALLVSGTFIVFFYALSINIAVFSILGSITLFILFFAQALIRKKNKANYVRDTAVVTLGNYFSTIDYNSNKENLVESFTSMLSEVFDASGVEYFVFENDELCLAHSDRNKTELKLCSNTALYKALNDPDITVLLRGSYGEQKKLFEVQEELEHLFTYFNSYAMIVLHGERNIISIISLGEKKLSIHYNKHDLELMRYFYSNFFVFGYYLQTSMKESLMGIIRREIDMSGQVTAAVNKNIDTIQDDAVDLGYFSRSPRNLGGDFIDVIKLANKKHMLVVGDVSGRGLNASMCMIILKSFIRSFVHREDNLIALVNKLNGFIKYNLPRGTFFAGTIMIHDSSDNTLHYVNCGVPGIFLYTKSYNNVIEVQGEGKVLGFAEDIENLLTVKKMQLNAGDIVLTCSDGVTDSLSLRGEEYGKRRIESLLMENRLFPAQNICSFLFEDIQAFTAKGISDDVSVLILKILQ